MNRFVFSYTSNILLIAHVSLNLDREGMKEVFNGRLEDEMDDLVFIKKDELSSFMSTMKSYKPLLPDLLEG